MNVYQQSFIVFPLFAEYSLQFAEEFGEAFADEVRARWVFASEVIGVLPLSNDVVARSVVGRRVVREHPSFDQQIAEADAPRESSEVRDFNFVASEEREQFFGFGVLYLEDLGFDLARVVGAVGHGAGVVITVESCEHDTQ